MAKSARSPTIRGATGPKESGKRKDASDPKVKPHLYGKSRPCATETRGFATPRNQSPTELVLDASEGFIPLWDENVTLRWRFEPVSLAASSPNPTKKASDTRMLIAASILAWGEAAPVKFAEQEDAWDFEVVLSDSDRCNSSGCVLASAFFPDQGRHQLIIYPKCFAQSEKEQIETLIHEIGHVFGLRHFFAAVSESAWPSVIFGRHDHFSIMNYGEESVLTDADKADLTQLYRSIWSGELTTINGTPITLVRPYHELRNNILGETRIAAKVGNCECCRRPF